MTVRHRSKNPSHRLRAQTGRLTWFIRPMIPNKLLPWQSRAVLYNHTGNILRCWLYDDAVYEFMSKATFEMPHKLLKPYTKNVYFTDWFFCVIHALWSVTGCTIHCHPFPTHFLTCTSKWLLELHNTTEELIKNFPCQNVTRFWFCPFNIITKLAFARV